MRITDALARHAAERPTELAAADARCRLTWRELDAAVAAAEAGLRGQGLVEGDRVALRAADGVPALVALLAVLRAGGVHAPIDHHLAEPEVVAAVQSLRAPWLAGTQEIARIELTATGQGRSPDPLGAGRSAFLRLTSGTTGLAKGVLLSHESLVARVRAANRGLHLGPEDRVLWLLPMAYHVAVSVLLYQEVGAALVFGNRLRASDMAGVARDHACTLAYASPWHVRQFAGLPAGALPAELRRLISTTTALDADLAGQVRARHGIPVIQALGIIECGLPLLSTGDVAEPVGRFRLLPDFQASILDAQGRALPQGAEGELAIAGPGLLDAYLEPWRERADILRLGAFPTGDVARIEADGAVQLLGRLKDVINVGGVKVFPLDVEVVLDAHPEVLASRVHAAPDPRSGERVVAEVQPVPGADALVLRERLGEWCAARLAPLKRPTDIVVVDRLSRTASGKVRR